MPGIVYFPKAFLFDVTVSVKGFEMPFFTHPHSMPDGRARADLTCAKRFNAAP
jgi:hypothetical protein